MNKHVPTPPTHQVNVSRKGVLCSPDFSKFSETPYITETLLLVVKVAVEPERSTNRNLKQIIMIECTKTVIFQLLRHLDISKLAKRELIQ